MTIRDAALGLVYAPVFCVLFVLVLALLLMVVFIGLIIVIYEDIKRSDFIARLLGL